MPRLIDADALMKYTQNQISRSIDCNDIARFPTIDAEPVVRCKDCKHRGVDGKCPMYHEEYIEEYEYILHDNTLDDGFCDCGERKDDE